MLPRGLESVTVTPGITAPDASVTVPPIPPTPCAMAGRNGHAHSANTTVSLTKRLTVIVIVIVLSSGRFRRIYSIVRSIHRRGRSRSVLMAARHSQTVDGVAFE